MTDAPLDVAELRQLLDRVSVGPWWSALGEVHTSCDGLIATFYNGSDDAQLVVAAVNALAALLDRLEAAEARVAELEAERDAWKLMAEGRSDLLVCYRGAGRSPDKALRKIEKAKAVLGEDA